MQFHTWPFLIFFVLAYGSYLTLRPTRYWLHSLLVSSYIFYGWWNPLYLLLILYSTALDYACVACNGRSHRRRWWLVLSLVNNLGLLGFFKYADFVTNNLNALLARFDVGYALRAPDVLLPVGISFFTFQSMSYTIDFYRGRLSHEPSFIRFATFVSFFPQLVAGPIERAGRLLPQFREPPAITATHLTDGVSLFLTGLMKKVGLANFLAAYADPIFANPSTQSASTLACATFAFAWQIYFDFSGYTDMARGIARVMGFDLMLNFNHPYLATGMKDFWARWHISLSTWFRDYVYVPLGGNRGGRLRMYRNLFLTMVISGFWHGAAWTFIIWGALHGLAYIAARPLEESWMWKHRVPDLLKRALVFLFVCVTWIFFRAADVPDALLIIRRIATQSWTDPAFPALAVVWVATIWVYQWISGTERLRPQYVSWLRVLAYTAITAYVSMAPGRVDQPFIYFQF